MPEYLQVLTTVSSEESALEMASAIIQRRLGACVQIVGPVTSVYRWEGKIENSQEWQCVIKTKVLRYPELEHAIRELHSYDVPEIIATPISAGHIDYLAWIDKETEPQD